MELRNVLILDGATGTQLQKRGFDGSICPEHWILEHPEAIIEIQKAYIDAGSRVVYAPTFGANRVKLESHRIFNKVEDFNLRLVALSKEAAGDRAWVAGDLAPTGLFLHPLGDTSFEELLEIYTEQAAALEKAGVDLFVIETMMTLAEARAAVLAVKSVSKKPVLVSFTSDENGRTLSGSDITAALVIMQGMGVDAFGLNCSVGPAEMLKQVERLREYAEIPLMAKANAGAPKLVDGKTVYDFPADAYASYVEAFAKAGVAIMGGCCGTEESHIAALSRKSANLLPADPSPKYSHLLPCATEKKPCYLDAEAAAEIYLDCDENLEDELSDALEEEPEMIAIEIKAFEQLDYFADCQYMISVPLCIVCDDAELLEQALRLYQGRALYEGSLSDKELMPLVQKYGLII